MNRPLAVAHRGYSTRFDENTVASCNGAIVAGADIIEADARFSADGTVFSLHDADLERLIGRDIAVADCSDVELQAIRLAQGEPLATLAEIATAIDGRASLLVDVKIPTEAMTTALQGILAAVPAPETIWLGLRSADQVRAAPRLLPACHIVGLIPSPDDAEAFIEAGAEAIRFWESEIDHPRLPELQSRLPVWVTSGGRGTGRAAGVVSPEQLAPILALEPAAVLLNDPTLITGGIRA